MRASLLSRFRLAGAAVIVGVAVLGAVLYWVVNTHYLGLIVTRTLGPYTDTLTDFGFAHADPEFWQAMAKRHGVDITVEPAEGDGGITYGKDGEARPAAPMATIPGVLRSTRIGPNGERATLTWQVLSFRESHLPLLLSLIFLVGAMAGVALWFLQRQLRPLTWLHAGVEAVARGDFNSRVPVVRDDEIGEVAGAFNTMAGRVGEMVEARERLLADVSHELRSPLARMKVALELTEPGEKRDSIARDLGEMESLIAALLEREVLRGYPDGPVGEPLELAAIVADAVDAVAHRPPGVRFAPSSAIEVVADPTLTKALLHNLLDNALKFSRPDSKPVEVSLEATDEFVVLRVMDDGIGIPAGREAELLEPFVKLDPARGHHSGYGLGLDLCRRIAELHGGTIELRRRSPRGTEAVVCLPRGAR